MASVQTLLAAAEARHEDAQAETDWMAYEATYRAALQAASDALVTARRAQDGEAKVVALEMVVDCNMSLGDLFAANLAATDELAMIRRTQDKKAEAKALALVAKVHSAREDHRGVADALQSVLALHQEAGDKQQQAAVMCQLARAKLAIGEKSTALSMAKDAMKLSQDINNFDGEREARVCINSICAATNQLDKAPDRAEALEALKDLETAVENHNALAWGTALETLERSGAYTEKDIDTVMKSTVEKDKVGATRFLEMQGMEVKTDLGGGARTEFQQFNSNMHYINMRVGGLNYGPSFRCGFSHMVASSANDPKSKHALVVLQVNEEAEEWESTLQYHPGVMDSMLQSTGLAAQY